MRSIARPTTTTSRPAAAAASAAERILATFDAKVVTATLARAVRTSSARVFATSRSEGERPSRMALVESPTIASTPASPAALSLASSVGGWMTGVGSIFQSPVWSTAPRAVRMISALDSGIEWATDTSSISNGPMANRDPSATTRTGISGAPGSPRLCSMPTAAASPALGLEQSRGERRGIDGHAQLRPKIEQRAEMILVGVGEHDAGEIAALLDQEPYVGQDEIDARQILASERHAEVDRDPGSAAFRAQAVDR